MQQEMSSPSRTEDAALSTKDRPATTKFKPDPHIVDRDALLDAMDEKIAAQREAEDAEFLESADPRAALLVAQMKAEAAGKPLPQKVPGGKNPAAELTGLEEPVNAIDEPAAEEAAPVEAEDPLADYVVKGQDGKPMFRTVVDGKVVLIALDKARERLQKHEAADARFQAVAAQRRELEAREAALAKAGAPPAAKVEEVDLDAEAVGIVRSLLSDPEEVAAKKMAGVLKKVRQAQAPVDPDAIASRAADLAVRTVAAKDDEKAKLTGYQKFVASYQDIVNDPDLYALADRKSDVIFEEHPDWTPEQIMMEAGKLTREWLEAKTGKKMVQPKPPVDNKPSERQIAKQGLRPMPPSRTARIAAEPESDVDDSPQAVINEMRKTRGQPY